MPRCESLLLEVALGGEADIGFCSAYAAFDPKRTFYWTSVQLDARPPNDG
jgi:hypothetical protein